MKPIRTKSSCTVSKKQRGFSLIEVLISTFVITIGLVSLLGAFAMAMATTQTAKQDMIAKQLAQEAMESVVTARETANVTWNQIQNVGGAGSPGVFVTNLQPINKCGIDGIIGTADDAGAGAETVQGTGPDGIVGTADDPAPTPLTDFQRSITITNTGSGDLRNITITVQYRTPQNPVRTYVLSGMISQYR
jgi:prepilin-type N-terminal cleavage/methylation domain-containing protein